MRQSYYKTKIDEACLNEYDDRTSQKTSLSIHNNHNNKNMNHIAEPSLASPDQLSGGGTHKPALSNYQAEDKETEK